MVTIPVPQPAAAPFHPPPPSGELCVLPFTVAIDTREQAPWLFRGLHGDSKDKYAPLVVPSERVTLPAGDYSIVGMESKIAIERKSEQDLWSTLGQGRDRFHAEHERLAEIVSAGGFACVLIEAEMAKSFADPPEWTRLNPASVAGTMTSWMLRFRVPWIWCGTRGAAEEIALRILRKQYKHDTPQGSLYPQ